MSFVVYKYPLPDTFGVFELELPEDAEILKFADQREKLVIWVKNSLPLKGGKIRHFILIGTGIHYEGIEVKKYIGTVQILGNLADTVCHLFEIME